MQNESLITFQSLYLGFLSYIVFLLSQGIQIGFFSHACFQCSKEFTLKSNMQASNTQLAELFDKSLKKELKYLLFSIEFASSCFFNL